MTTMGYAKRSIGGVMLMMLTMFGVQAPAYAGMVGTGTVIDQQQAVMDRGQLLNALNREDVREQLIAMGVDPQAARERVASLSDEELRTVSGHMRDLPAGGDILGVVLLVFLVLLFTDIMGYTHIFPFVKKTVH
ncbi:MAG: PA2779 family protein [Gammaproteobacteria bacterium]|jgi:hypothetical protein